MQISYYSSKFPPDLATIDSCLTYSSLLRLQNDFPSPVSCLVWQSPLGFLLWARAPSLSFTYPFVIGVDSHIASFPVVSNSVLYIPVLVLSSFLRFDKENPFNLAHVFLWHASVFSFSFSSSFSLSFFFFKLYGILCYKIFQVLESTSSLISHGLLWWGMVLETKKAWVLSVLMATRVILFSSPHRKIQGKKMYVSLCTHTTQTYICTCTYIIYMCT